MFQLSPLEIRFQSADNLWQSATTEYTPKIISLTECNRGAIQKWPFWS